MLLMVSSIWCPWPCKSIVDSTDVLFYAGVSLIVGLIVGYYVGRRARQTPEAR